MKMVLSESVIEIASVRRHFSHKIFVAYCSDRSGCVVKVCVCATCCLFRTTHNQIKPTTHYYQIEWQLWKNPRNNRKTLCEENVVDGEAIVVDLRCRNLNVMNNCYEKCSMKWKIVVFFTSWRKTAWILFIWYGLPIAFTASTYKITT